jgi:hypothetical protein
VNLVLKSDFFNSLTFSRVIFLINALMDHLPPSAFGDIVPLVIEQTAFADGPLVLSEIFFLLSHFPALPGSKSLEQQCLRLMHHYYWSFTQMPTFLTFSEPPKGTESILTSITTDIVADPGLSPPCLFRPLINCFKYFLSVPPKTTSLTQLAITLLAICPNESLSALRTAPEQSLVDCLIPDILLLMQRSENWSTISLAADVLRRNGNPANNAAIFKEFQVILDSKSIDRASVAGSLFRMIIALNSSHGRDFLVPLLSHLPVLERHVFLVMILAIGIPDEIRKQYPFLIIEKSKTVIQWFTANPLRLWPLRDPDFIRLVTNFFQQSKTPIAITDLEGIDRDQFLFLSQNRSLFDVPSYDQFISSRILWLRAFMEFPRPTQPFVFLPFDRASLSDFVTFSPMLARGEFVINIALLRSFFQFSRVKISPMLFRQIVAAAPELADIAKEYAWRLSISEVIHRIPLPDIAIPRKSILRQTCIRLSGPFCRPLDVELAAKQCLSHLPNITTAAKVFLCLRILRVVYTFTGITAIFRQSVLTELRHLVTALAPRMTVAVNQELGQLLLVARGSDATQTDEFLSSAYSGFFNAQCSKHLLKRKIPSFHLLVLRSLNIVVTLESKIQRLISNPIIGPRWIEAVATHARALESPARHLSLLLTRDSPLLPITPPAFVADLLARCPEWQQCFEQFLQSVYDGDYPLPNLIPLAALYFGHRKAHPDYVIGVLTAVFCAAPTFEAALELAECLKARATQCDCVNLILTELAFSVSPCYLVLMVAHKFLSAASEEHIVHFRTTLESVRSSLPYNSRERAFGLLTDSRPTATTVAFLYSLVDSNDGTALDGIYRQNI